MPCLALHLYLGINILDITFVTLEVPAAFPGFSPLRLLRSQCETTRVRRICFVLASFVAGADEYY